jgi:hypothetical protein
MIKKLEITNAGVTNAGIKKILIADGHGSLLLQVESFAATAAGTATLITTAWSKETKLALRDFVDQVRDDIEGQLTKANNKGVTL